MLTKNARVSQPTSLRMRLVLSALFMAFVSSVFAAEAVSQTSTKAKRESQAEDDKPLRGMHLYLLVGQSNMAGRGRISPEDKKPLPRVYMLTKELQWKPAVAPLHFDKPSVVGVGVGRTFAKQMLANQPDVVIGLIPAAAGGSPIDSWKPGGYHRQTKSHPYDDAIRRAKAALKHGELKGILWHQGESDSKPNLAEAYEKKLHDLIVRIRTDLSANRAPFVAGQMGQFKERPWNASKKIVDQAQRELAKKVELTAFVKSDGLKHKGDQIHFDAASYRELGRRYAKAMQALQAKALSAAKSKKP